MKIYNLLASALTDLSVSLAIACEKCTAARLLASSRQAVGTCRAEPLAGTEQRGPPL